MQCRARLLADPEARPYLTEAISFPETRVELFFDIEADPVRDICYLHGFVERTSRDPTTERFVGFIAERPTNDEEERAYHEALEYIRSK